MLIKVFADNFIISKDWPCILPDLKKGGSLQMLFFSRKRISEIKALTSSFRYEKMNLTYPTKWRHLLVSLFHEYTMDVDERQTNLEVHRPFPTVQVGKSSKLLFGIQNFANRYLDIDFCFPRRLPPSFWTNWSHLGCPDLKNAKFDEGRIWIWIVDFHLWRKIECVIVH